VVFERVFKGDVIEADSCLKFCDHMKTKFKDTLIKERCIFLGYSYIFECCSFLDTPKFNYSLNTFVDCKYLDQDMCNENAVAVIHFHANDTNGDPQQYTLTIIQMADTKDHTYIWNNTKNKVIHDYEEIPLEWNLHWDRGCLKKYLKAMKNNFKLNQRRIN
jgi:hypothetical protein